MDQPTLQDLVRRFKIPEHVLNGELSEKHLRDVTRFIDHNTLGPELGLTSQNMNDINVVVGPEDLRRIATLRKWKQTFAYNATYRKLIEALLKCSKADQAVEVCKLLIQNGEQSSSDLPTPPYSPGNMTDGHPWQVMTLPQFAEISNDGSAFSEIIFEMKDGWDGTLEDAEKIGRKLIRDDFAAEYTMSFKRLRNSLVWAVPRSCPINMTVLHIPPAFYRDNHVRRVLVKGVCTIDMKFEEEEQEIVAKPTDINLQLQEKLQQKEGEVASLQDTVEVMAAAEDVYKQKFKELEENKKAELQIHELQREVYKQKEERIKKAESQVHELNVALDQAQKNISDLERLQMQAARTTERGVSHDKLADLRRNIHELQQEKELQKKTTTIAQLEKEMKRREESFWDQFAPLEEKIPHLQAQMESPDKIDDSDKRERSLPDLIAMVKSNHMEEVILEKYEKSERDLLQEIKRVKGVEGRKPTPPTGKDFVESRGIRYSMKYGSVAGNTSETMILVSVGSEFQSDIQVKRRVRDPAMAEKAINRHGRLPTTPIALQEETAADLMARASLTMQTTSTDLVRLCLDVPGKQRSKQYYLQAIEEFFKNCQEPVVTLVYLGHSQKGTGNWCFKDGTISFREIFDLHRQICPGKRLNIMPDCCYSGQWVIDCAKTLDSFGIPPCGHRAREQVLIKVYASCKPDQKAAEPCYSIEAIKIGDDGSLLYYTKKKVNETQTFYGTNFTKLTCCRGPDESCRSEEALKNWTWEDAIDGGLSSSVYIVRGKDRGRQVWHFVLLSNKSEEYKERFLEQVKSGTVNVNKWGYVIQSGWGKDLPDSVEDRISLWMGL